MGMDGFDMVSMGVGLFDPENPLVQFNQKLHSSVVYNVLQTGINALAIFTGVATTTMTCFVAGTMILTATGLVAIEKIQAGDIVISRNPETKETAEKIVVETYIREDRKLIHLVINGEKITTTETHPFYVNKKGFVEAGKLKPGEELVDVNNNIVKIEEYSVEITKEPTPVYNFQVEDFHTYFVGNNSVLVHNADYEIKLSRSKYPESANHIEEAIEKGHPSELTLDRKMARTNRKASLRGKNTVPGMDRDEYPFAMTKEGGFGADIKHISPADNRGSGAYLRWQLDKVPDGKTFKIEIVD